MGLLLSKFRSKETSKDRLERISEEIRSLEDHKFSAIKQQKNIIFLLFVISGLIYVIVFGVFYFYYLPISLDWQQRCIYSLPLVIFPLIVYLLKQFLQWYYHQVIDMKEDKLRGLRQEKRKILEKVMETETYKVAKELLEKYDPSALKESRPNSCPSSPANTSQYSVAPNVRYRGSIPPPMKPNVSFNNYPRTPERPRLTMSSFNASQNIYGSPPPNFQASPDMMRQSFPSFPALPPPRMARPILNQDRTMVEKLVDYVVGDGPNNRYALICKACNGHNGMALKEEFEFMAFRCCYCMMFNPARKERPFAPTINDLTSPESNRDRNLSPLIDEPESDTDSRDSHQEQSTNISEVREPGEVSDAEGNTTQARKEHNTEETAEEEPKEAEQQDVQSSISQSLQSKDSSESDLLKEDEGEIDFIDDENEDGEKRVLL